MNWKSHTILTALAATVLSLHVVGWFGLPLWFRLVNLMVFTPALVLITFVLLAKAKTKEERDRWSGD
ncbi:MAG: hypothetical protein KAI66_10865 [Lentisphaeria bacterium]|nr:hypothetical protein [Lentisphaeria bacterium]